MLTAVGADGFDGQEKAIATFVNGFNDARPPSVVLECFAKSGDAAGENIVRDKNIGPDGGNELFFCDDALVLGEIEEHLHGFRFDAHAVAVFRNEVDGRADEPLADYEIALHGKNLQSRRPFGFLTYRVTVQKIQTTL